MEAIHFKTVDANSHDLLRSAAQQGIELNWERYERLQPQDGFLRLGLSCPFGCMEGPCRIDPFGRGPDRGLCGLDRDGMVAALLLRLSLQGALEASAGKALQAASSGKSWPSPLKGMASRAIKHLGGRLLSSDEIFQSASLMQRPETPPERLIEQALRLSILTLMLSEPKEVTKPCESLDCKVGYGLLSENKVFVGIAGQPPQNLLSSLSRKISSGPIPVQLVSLGDWIPLDGNLLPFACTSGEAELLLSSGTIHLLIAGTRTDPSLIDLCRRLNIPSVTAQETPRTEDILRMARQRHASCSQKRFPSNSSSVGEGRVMTDAQELKRLFKKGPSAKLALIGGCDTLHQTMGSLPIEVATALSGKGHLVASWGDAALWMIKKGLGSGEHNAISVLDQDQGPLLALKALAPGKLKDVRGICFVGLRTCKDLATAFALAALGARVCVAVPLPLWGSEKVRHLLTEKLGAMGGTMTHFDHPAGTQEVIDWFEAGK